MTRESLCLKMLRKEREMTQREFASWLDIPLITLAQWEQGTRTPPTYVIKLIQFKCEHSTKGEQLEYSIENDIKRKYIGVIYHKKSDCLIRESLLRNEEDKERFMTNWEEYTEEKGYITRFYKIKEENQG